MAGVAPSTIMDGGGHDTHTSSVDAGGAEPSDASLALRAQHGDRAALEALVHRHQRSVQRLCLRYVRDSDEAADLVQRTFLRAMEGLADLRAVEAFRSWVLRIAANLALNHVRDHARFVREDDPARRPVTASGPGAVAPPQTAGPLSTQGADAAWENSQTARALRQAVLTLPTKQRLTLELRVHEELSFRDIAEALGTTENAAKVNFHHAVRNLKERLRPPGNDSGSPNDSERPNPKRRGS